MEFDEQAAIDFIRTKLPESAQHYDDDEILNVIDIIWDYYDENGMLEIDLSDDDEDEVDTSKLIEYVKKMVAKDRHSPITPADVEAIVNAELDYEDTLF